LDGSASGIAGPAPRHGAGIVRDASADASDPALALDRIADALGPGPFALVVLFATNRADMGLIARLASARFPGEPVIGCSTAGEIGPEGYAEGTIVALALPASHFAASVTLFRGLERLQPAAVAREVLEARQAVASRQPDWESEFALLLVDGMSRCEDPLVSAIAPALGATPLFGGSAGDGLDFRHTFVIAEGRAMEDAAVLVTVRTRCDVEVFRLDHFRPTERRMVVTRADPANRLVSELNAEPAAPEYARVIGRPPSELTPNTFASHPVVVRLGGQHHVRAIQKVEPNGDLRFYSAIDEGLVLTIAEPLDIVAHLDSALSRLAARRAPEALVMFDCILRRLEAEQRQATREVSAVLARHGVVGFSTYGEQYNSLHVNQTFTGVAIYAPPED
jgi:hypothetical protein